MHDDSLAKFAAARRPTTIAIFGSPSEFFPAHPWLRVEIRALVRFTEVQGFGSGLLWHYFFWPISIATFLLGTALESYLGSCGLNTPEMKVLPPDDPTPYRAGGSGPLACTPALCSATTKSLASALSTSEAACSIRTLRPDSPLLRPCAVSTIDQPEIDPKVFTSSWPYVHISPSPLTETIDIQPRIIKGT